MKMRGSSMPSKFEPVKIGPWTGGMRNSTGLGENIADNEVYELTNLEVDLDGSFVNRPAINDLSLSLSGGGSLGSTTGIRVLGKYLPNDGRIFIVASFGGNVRLMTASSGVFETVSATVDSVAVVQYNNKLWVIPKPGTSSNGGYFDATSPTITWTAVAAIPQGESAVLYKERIFVGCGISATSNTARVRFCAVGDPLVWNGSDNFDVSPGDGEKLVDLVTVSNDIIILKEHSTWRFTYAKLPSQADLTNIDRRIGTPAINCAVVYNSNTVYVLHDNAVYELVNAIYKRISAPIAMTQTLDATLNAADTYGLTLFRDRLFVRYYANVYVYALRVQRWSRWTMSRKFSKIIVIPTASLGLDTAYMHSASSSDPGKIYYFRDDRVTGVGSAEDFDCSFQTKVMHFDIPQDFKAISHGGLNVAASGNLTATLKIPNSTQNNTWDYEAAHFIWSDPGNWDDQDQTIYSTVVAPAAGEYNVKFVRCIKRKFRFRTVYFLFTIAAEASTNGADSSVKVVDMVLYLREAQQVSKETN